MLRTLCHGFCDLLFPSNCLLCKQHAPNDDKKILCTFCRNSIELNTPPFCQKCSRHIKSTDISFCTKCLRCRYHFEKVWAVCCYEGSFKKLLHIFKYNQKTQLRHHFSRIISTFARTYQLHLNQFDLIVPVPLHPTRLRERGYNQTGLFASALAHEFQVPYLENQLIRIHHTPQQALLRQKERWTNIQGAFKIKNSMSVDQKTVLIVDDLMTTGATLSEAARILKEAGAKNVTGLTLAITS